MKKAIIVSLLFFTSLNIYAQPEQPDATSNPVCKGVANMPARSVRVWPRAAYIPLESPSCPPCYEYTRRSGLKVMECPFLLLPAGGSNPGVNTVQADAGGHPDVQAASYYAANYPTCKRAPDMPANGKAVWPKSDYTAVGNPACPPCYEYTKRSGLKVMECPDLWLPPENK